MINFLDAFALLYARTPGRLSCQSFGGGTLGYPSCPRIPWDLAERALLRWCNMHTWMMDIIQNVQVENCSSDTARDPKATWNEQETPSSGVVFRVDWRIWFLVVETEIAN